MEIFLVTVLTAALLITPLYFFKSMRKQKLTPKSTNYSNEDRIVKAYFREVDKRSRRVFWMWLTIEIIIAIILFIVLAYYYMY